MSRTTSLSYLGAVALLAGRGLETTPALASEGDPGGPEMITRNVPARGDVMASWQLPPTSPWSPYEKLTLLSVMAAAPELVTIPRVDAIDDVRLAQLAAAQVASQGVAADALWMVDLRGAASVAFGTALSRRARESIAVIPTFNNWPAQDELIPAEETLSAMISLSPRLPEAGDASARPVFLLDSWRLAFKDETIDDHVTDNRYMLSPSDFPSAYELVNRGVSHVVYLVTDTNEETYEEDDLNMLFGFYQAAGIEIQRIDLAQLVGVVDEPWQVAGGSAWRVDARNRFYVQPRRTIVYDASFYARAQGGFGGAQGVPLGEGGAYMIPGGVGGG